MRKKTREYVASVLQGKIEACKDTIRNCRKALKDLEGDEFGYVVRLESLWAREGELGAIGRGKTLKKAVESAEDAFRRINERSDVQASYWYSIEFPDGASVDLPEGHRT